MDKYNVHNMLEELSSSANTEISKGIDKVNTKEMGEVVDMIKDLTEAEKNKMEACYYSSIIEAMEKSEYGEDYDYEGPIYEERMGYRRGQMGRRNYPMRDKRMHDDRYDDYMMGRMSYSNGAYGGGSRGMSTSGTSRYGYSYDNYMRNRANYSTSDPEDKQERMKMLDEYTKDLVVSISDVMQDVTPEEKTMLKTKLSKLVNTMQ